MGFEDVLTLMNFRKIARIRNYIQRSNNEIFSWKTKFSFLDFEHSLRTCTYPVFYYLNTFSSFSNREKFQVLG